MAAEPRIAGRPIFGDYWPAGVGQAPVVTPAMPAMAPVVVLGGTRWSAGAGAGAGDVTTGDVTAGGVMPGEWRNGRR